MVAPATSCEDETTFARSSRILRAAIAFAILDSLYYALTCYDPLTATTPLYVLAALAGVAALLAAYQAYANAQFHSAARSKLATISYTQVRRSSRLIPVNMRRSRGGLA